MKKRFSLFFVIVLVWVVSIGCSDSELEENSEKNPVRVSDGNIDIVGTWQLVDYEPNDFEKLPEMVNLAENSKTKQLVNQVLLECMDTVKLTNTNPRIVLILGDGNNETLTQAMQNAIGVSLGSKISLIFFWPQHHWKASISFAVAHEYSHLYQNSYVEKNFNDC